MISRRTTLVLAEVYEILFNKTYADYRSEFLFEYSYPDWVCLALRGMSGTQLRDWIKNLHMGRVPIIGLQSEQEREQEGQKLLRRLAENILKRDKELYDQRFPRMELVLPLMELRRRLELDGYLYRDGILLESEIDILDTTEEAGVLANLYAQLKLKNQDVALHCLKLSEEHWLNRKWDDCIGNARKFLEAVLREVAVLHSLKQKQAALPDKSYASAELVRQYLRAEGLLEPKEEEAIRVIYGLLSNTGNHPYVAEQDQARLLRQVALIFAHFVMLRFQGWADTMN